MSGLIGIDRLKTYQMLLCKSSITHKIALILLIVISIFSYFYHTTTIYIIRHGEKVIQKGIQDAPLTDNGKIQAKKLGQYLAHKKSISHLWASPMRRARQTAEIIALQTGASISFDSRLVEQNYRQSEKLYPDGTHIYVKFLKDGQKESKAQHLSRLLSFLKDSIGLLDKELYIVAHGGLVNRILEKIAADSKPSQTPKIKYCSMFIFKYNKITKNFRYIEHVELKED
jgi:probable phosphoglycerate mutase